MNFFCTKKHYDVWFSKNDVDEEIAFCLDASEALTVARMIFRVDETGPADLRGND
jgi:hypothetical protein